MAYIFCGNLVVGYDGKAVSPPVSFDVEKGSYVCILGENGSGKTTLMRTLVGLQKKISGEILFGDGLCKNETGYLPQKLSVSADFPASVREIVLSGTLGQFKNRFFYGKAQKMIADEQMEKVGISSLARRRFTELSGGQQQRTLLARALCAAKKLIFLDEPVSALDPAAAKEFYAILEKLNNEGLSVVMVSHDLDCLDYASHILSFCGGKIQFESRADFCKDTSSGKSDEKRN